MSLGFYLQPWQTVDYVESPSIGRFEGTAFDPPAWKPRIPTAAFLRARADDTFWAARRVAAFSNEMIRALVNTGHYTAPDAAGHLTEVLVQRRNKIAAAYLTPINPVVNLTLGAEGLSFENAAVAAGVAPAPKGGYRVRWSRFDNATGETTELALPAVVARPPVPAPANLPGDPGAYLKVQVSAVQPPHAAWETPIDAYFRRTTAGWKLVGLTRQPDGPAEARAAKTGTQPTPRRDHDSTRGGEIIPRTGAVAHRGRASRRGRQRAADDAADVPRPGGVLHAEDRPRGVHPHRRGRRGEELLVGRPGGAAPGARAGVRRLRVTRQPRPAGDQRDAVLRLEPAALPVRRAGGPARRHRVLPLGRHLQPDGHRAVLGVCRRPVHA